ncbi:MAG: 50S ribosomal protein L16 [Candidatus Brockarchaeota archaeon]|nr:50S ribosomal protein L16 [Candidatus Brockarchaeota archaeon]
MPYARKEYISGAPPSKLSRFTLGKFSESFTNRYVLEAAEAGLLQHGALEAARVAANKVLQDRLGENNYFLRIIPYPHIVLRAHKFLAQAGADRLSQGMKNAYGKPVGLAARVRIGDPIMEVRVGDANPEVVKEAYRISSSKIPLKCRVRAFKAEGEEK